MVLLKRPRVFSRRSETTVIDGSPQRTLEIDVMGVRVEQPFHVGRQTTGFCILYYVGLGIWQVSQVVRSIPSDWCLIACAARLLV